MLDCRGFQVILSTSKEKWTDRCDLQTDRTTAIGRMIDAYLQSQSELDDRAIHLLFSANRWECACVPSYYA